MSILSVKEVVVYNLIQGAYEKYHKSFIHNAGPRLGL